jgi:hypothetical protein
MRSKRWNVTARYEDPPLPPAAFADAIPGAITVMIPCQGPILTTMIGVRRYSIVAISALRVSIPSPFSELVTTI